MVYYRFCAIIGKINKKTPLIIVAAQKNPKLLILRKIITGQKKAADPEPKRIIGTWSSPAPIHRSTCVGTLVV